MRQDAYHRRSRPESAQLKPHVASSLLLATLSLTGLLAAPPAERAEPALTEKQVKTLLQENQKRLEQARQAQRKNQTADWETHLREYTESTQKLNAALAEDRIDAADPEAVLWTVDAAAVRQRKLLEAFRASAPASLRALVEEALGRARLQSRAALDAISRLRRGEFRLGGKSGPRIHQQKDEEIWVPTPGGPQRRPRPTPEPPPGA